MITTAPSAANLLRVYHRVLGEAKTRRQLKAARWHFWATLQTGVSPSPKLSAALEAVRSAHRARIAGEGSPAACDAALAQAIKDIGNG